MLSRIFFELLIEKIRWFSRDYKAKETLTQIDIFLDQSAVAFLRERIGARSAGERVQIRIEIDELEEGKFRSEGVDSAIAVFKLQIQD